jgi:shikimate dehydrogenase
MDRPTRCAVLGSPIAHSLSPVLHRAAYAELGLDWSYRAIEVTEAGLADFLAGLDDSWRGLSLTMPLKRAVLPLLDEADDLVRRSGVANTVLLGEGGRRGRNTDVPGAAAALRERLDGRPERVVVLGGGATAASVLFAVAGLGCRRATLLVRDPARAADTLAAVGRLEGAPVVEVATLGTDAGTADLLVSTIPAAAQAGLDLDALVERSPAVFEVAYDPWPTPLATAAERHGRRLVGGLDLLVHQAALQVELMTGQPAPLAAMRTAGERALRTGER